MRVHVSSRGRTPDAPKPRRRSISMLAVVAMVGAMFAATVGAASAATPTSFFNGFETDTSGWFDNGGTITRADASYTSAYAGSLLPATGSHDARLHVTTPCTQDCSGPFTRFGGYSTTFPTGGYTTKLSIYLDTTDSSLANDSRFDWISAISTPGGVQRRDFVFNAGFYNSSDATGPGAGTNRWVIATGNNSTRGSSYPKDSGHDPIAITASGWYTFVHHFQDNGSGVLAVDLSIFDSGGTLVHTRTLSDPTDVIGSTVGGNRYGWFSNQEIDSLPIDDSALILPDTTGPITSSVVVTPNPVALNTASTLTALVDDSTTGGSNIASAQYRLDNGAWTAMSASDGAFDEPTETVTATIPAQSSAGVSTLCVKGTDAATNTGAETCIDFVVYDPSSGFVTGGGWINSPVGAYTAAPSLTGKATFGFVSKYQKGATVPNGNTAFNFATAGLSFSSDTYNWLVVNQGGTNAQFKGTGTLNGVSGYSFMVWATDNGSSGDTFRISISDSTGTVVYDNGVQQSLGGGSIIVHK